MQKVDDSILINFCILPPKNVSNSYNSLSQSLKSPATLFNLGDDKFAHMTVYMARFPRQAVDKLIAAAQKALEGQKSFYCVHCGYYLTEGRYLEASYYQSTEIRSLHENLITMLHNLRYRPGNPKIESYFGPYNLLQQKNAQETGYDLAHSFYRPHVTLTRYAENKVPTAFPAMPKAKLSFECQTIAMYEADENGAVFKKLAEFTI